MKKTILSFLLVSSAALVMAQQPTYTNPNQKKNVPNGSTNQNLNTNPNRTNSNVAPPDTSTTNLNNEMNVSEQEKSPQPDNGVVNSTATTTSYSFTVPASIQTNFTTQYPGVTGNVWVRSGDWYRSRYVDNGTIREVSYREDGKSLTSTVSPIMQSYVPQEMVAQAIQRYGASVYAIGVSKGSDGQELYHVTVIENGESKTEWMNADGTVSENHFRKADETNSMMPENQHMDAQQRAEDLNRDSTQQQVDTTHMNREPVPEQQPAQPQSKDEPQNNDERGPNTGTNDEGINNASGINLYPKRK